MDYNKLLSKRAKGLKPSGIRKFFDVASTLKDCISLGVGEPDFKTPWNVRQAGIESLQKGHTFYTSNQGLIELRRSISSYMQHRFDLEYDHASEVIVTVGGSEAIDIAVRAIANPGDEILICEPCFVSYTAVVELAGATAVPLVTRVEDDFRLTPEALKSAITEKTRMVILSFPSNPTGAVMEREHLEGIAEVLRGTDILVLSDEIYAELTYTGNNHVSIANLSGMKERTIIVSGFSKAYAMTGWRLGYLCAPAPLCEVMNKIHQYAIMCAPTTAQYAAIVALDECHDEVVKMREQYNERRRLMVKRLNAMGLDCFEPKGAFYIFPSIKRTGLSSEEFCNRLLHETKVAVVPGNAFGDSGEGYVRISYSYSIKHLTTALDRIEGFCEQLIK